MIPIHELMVLAAKAACWYKSCQYVGWIDGKEWWRVFDGQKWHLWNPRDDDAHAFRLAVRIPGPYTLKYTREDYEVCNEDGVAATRLAVLKAAAEVGRLMP